VSPTAAVAVAAAAWAEADAAAALPAAAVPPCVIPARPGTAGIFGRLREGDMEVSLGRLAAWLPMPAAIFPTEMLMDPLAMLTGRTETPAKLSTLSSSLRAACRCRKGCSA